MARGLFFLFWRALFFAPFLAKSVIMRYNSKEEKRLNIGKEEDKK